MNSPVTIEVSAEHTYPVIIGRGLLGELPELCAGAQKVAVIHSATLAASAEAVREDLEGSGFECYLLEVPAGEDAKTAAVAAFAWDALGASGFTRSDVVVGLGGGSTTDLAGFVAAQRAAGKAVDVKLLLLLGAVLLG